MSVVDSQALPSVLVVGFGGGEAIFSRSPRAAVCRESSAAVASRGPHGRGNARCHAAWTLGVDGDYYEKGLGHSPPPDDARKSLVPALANVLAGALHHETPRGFRNVLLLDRCIIDKEEHTKLATVIRRRVERGLADADILGVVRRGTGGGVSVERERFIVDTGALFDRARLFFTPNAAVEGEPTARRAKIVVLGGAS